MKEKEKLKAIKAEERQKTRIKKFQKKYGIPMLNSWVEEHPNTVTRLSYEVYLEEEDRIHGTRILGRVLILCAFVTAIVSFFSPGFLFSTILFLLSGSDTLTNVRIDSLEQRRWEDTLMRIFDEERKEEKNVKNRKGKVVEGSFVKDE